MKSKFQVLHEQIYGTKKVHFLGVWIIVEIVSSILSPIVSPCVTQPMTWLSVVGWCIDRDDIDLCENGHQMTWIGNSTQGYTLVWIGYEIVAFQDKDVKAIEVCSFSFPWFYAWLHIPKGAQYDSFDARLFIQDSSLIPKYVGLIVAWSMIVSCLSLCWPTFYQLNHGS